jgi:hypothetical protein
MENIPHLAPFEREEGKLIEGISAREQLEKIIKFSDDSLEEKKPQDIIMAAKDYVERLGGVDEEKAKELISLIERAEKEFHTRRMAEVGPIAKVHNQRKK